MITVRAAAGAGTSSGSRLAKSAIAYACKLGWPVFPLAPKSKLPLIGRQFGGRGVLDATKDETKLAHWWDINPEANIAIATGTASSFFVLDIDVKSGGEASLADLERDHGPLPNTPMQHTGGGGRHYLFRHVVGIRNSAGKIASGVDVRGDGGYIVAPPSVHENGRLYAWDVDQHPTETPLADAPAGLVEKLRVRGTGPAETPQAWLNLVTDGVAQGQRNEAIARLTGHLLRKYVDPNIVLDLMRVWNAARCRPALDDEEIVRTVDSICRKEIERRERVTK